MFQFRTLEFRTLEFRTLEFRTLEFRTLEFRTLEFRTKNRQQTEWSVDSKFSEICKTSFVLGDKPQSFRTT
jgi:hypothetical protein